ncbi:MAG: hypothetical protein CME64_18165 [Halobacteriovoraceae bacterium]|nr:hypothetical protein [Halobacteriovoraceae bacterium]|tara:strand:+ start:32873 stop:33451 length:579 start_codon:yes stop_codon:yes gene_type:complete
MENLLLTLVIVLLLALIGVIGLLVWTGHRYLKLQEQKNEPKKDAQEPEVLQTRPKAPSDVLKSIRTQLKTGLYCVDHEDQVATGHCAISGEAYCEHCLTKQKDIKVAKKFLDLYLDSEWVEVAMMANAEVSQDAVDRLVKVKRCLWEENSLPMIVQGHYKINVQNDEIEAFTVIIARKEDCDYIQKELSFMA